MKEEEKKSDTPSPSDPSAEPEEFDPSDEPEEFDPSDEPEEFDPSDEPEESDESDLPGELIPREELLSRLESLIFCYPEPISVRRLARILSLKGRRVRELVADLQGQYAGRGINIGEVSGGFQFHTNPVNADVVRAAIKVKPMRISRPALETLAIIAYRQPVTRADVEDIRRVDSGGTMKFLFERELIRVLGRKEEPGRPMIYGTSAAFLELFGLKSLGDLPSLHEFTELWDEHRELLEEESDLSDVPDLPDGPEEER
jgi:segregation and condensation protein B